MTDAAPRPKPGKKLARLQARLDALTGKGTEQMRASLRAQIDAIEAGPPPAKKKGGRGRADQ